MVWFATTGRRTAWLAKRLDPENYYRRNGVHYHPYSGLLKQPTDLEDFERMVQLEMSREFDKAHWRAELSDVRRMEKNDEEKA